LSLKPRVAVLLDYYLPSVKAGGPVRSVANLVERLGTDFDFCVVTKDRDLGERRHYDGVPTDRWVSNGLARVYYMSPVVRWLGGVVRLLRAVEYDVLYLNSFFSPSSLQVLLARRLGLLQSRKTVVAPRGQFSEGALGLKGLKKRIALSFARWTGMNRGVVWHATREDERDWIRRAIGEQADVVVAGNLAGASDVDAIPPEPKVAGSIRIVTLARVNRMKNIHNAISLMAGLRGAVEYDIVGPLEDAAYVKECEAAARGLGPNIRVRFLGGISPSSVHATLSRYHLFFLPTLNENYGHAIGEALAAGVPVLLSDRTPWRDLARMNAGWDVPLESPERFRDVLSECIEMGAERHRVKSAAAKAAAVTFTGEWDRTSLAAYHELLRPSEEAVAA